METVTRQIVKLFHRASQMDAEQCVSRLICEVNADPEKPKSVRTILQFTMTSIG